MPTILAAAPQLDPKIRLVVVSVDDQASEALQFLQRLTPQVPAQFQYWDSDKSLSQSMGISRFPETYIYNEHHELVRKVSGAMNWTDKANLSFLQSLH